MAVLPIGMSSSEAGGYQIQRSLRFNRSDSAYLNRTPSSTGSQTTYTLSVWVKLGNLTTGVDSFIWSSGDASVGDAPSLNWKTFDGTYAFVFAAAGTTNVITSSVYRDPSAWYHIVVSVDTTQATASNRVRIYVNGAQITSLSTATYPTQNSTYNINTSSYAAYIGCIAVGASRIRFFEGYLADINFIDGSALTPSSFGETDTDTSVWKPKAYTGSYGTNGFYLKFADNSGTTSTTLGKDSSPNGNNWTPNNFSVTAGAGNDSLVDTPTPYGTDTGAGGEVRGNYCTLNPLQNGGLTLTNGNLWASKASANWVNSWATFGMSSGKWYWEFNSTSNYSASVANQQIGITKSGASISTYIGADANGWALFQNTGDKWTNNSGSSYMSGGWASGDVIGVAFDADAGTLTFYKNNVSQGTAFSSLTSGPYFPAVGFDGTSSANLNFGQRPFAYTAPSGFKALCTQNLPEPTVVQGDDYFTPVLYTGDGTNNRFISAGMTPDFTWIKERGRAASHFVFDTLRGASNYLSTNQTGAENFAGDLGWTNTGPTTGGFKVDAGTNDSINYNTGSYVAWNWKANGSGVSNTDGSITSTVSANTTSGFSIVTWTGNGTNGATVGHGLGAHADLIIVKNRSITSDWPVCLFNAQGQGMAWSHNCLLNSTAAQSDSLANGKVRAATSNSTTFETVSGASGISYVNGSGNSMVAYCFAAVPGFSAFGSYTGNGSTDGPFIYTGFRPAFVMIKQSSAAGEHWVILDNERNTSNVENKELYANLSNAEGSNAGNATLDFVSNGFKIRTTNAGQNTSSATYIYACFAEVPFRYSLAR